MDILDGLLVAAVFCGVLTFCWRRREHGRYNYNLYSDVQRRCDACGQEQWAYCDAPGSGGQWWEAVGRVVDPKCKCHKDTK